MSDVRTRESTAAIAILPGVGLAAAVTVVATVLGGFAPVVGAPVFAIVIGIAISVVRSPGARVAPGIRFTSKRVLQGSIIVLGFGLSLGEVARVGSESLPVLAGTLAAVLGVAWLAGRRLGIRRDTTVLVGVGTAICGASAIAATSAAIDADDADVSYAVATIFLFNVVAVLTYPALGHALGLSQQSFGLLAGTAINDTSSVVAAANIYGAAALSYAVVVKLTRTLAIIPITLALAWWWNHDTHGVEGQRPPLRRVFPGFIVGFIAAVLVNSAGVVPDAWHDPLAHVATWMITAALAAIGLSTNVAGIRRAGFRPILLGGVLWVTVGLASIALQAATDTL